MFEKGILSNVSTLGTLKLSANPYKSEQTNTPVFRFLTKSFGQTAILK